MAPISVEDGKGTLSDTIAQINAMTYQEFSDRYFPENWQYWTHPHTSRCYKLCRYPLTGLLPQAKLEACFNLIRTTSEKDYKACKKWVAHEKLDEMREEGLKYVIIEECTSSDIGLNTPVRGFMSFMVDLEYGIPSVYMYEIHLDKDLRGSGLGTYLMDLLEDIAKAVPIVEKVVFSCFSRNKPAVMFYKKLGYGIDEYSPKGRTLRSGQEVEAPYIAMSKKISH